MENQTNPQPSQKTDSTRRPAIFGFAYRYRTPKGNWSIKFLYGKIFTALFAIFLTLLLFKTIFIFVFFKYQRDYSEITVKTALFYPLNRMQTNHALGDYNIRNAKDLLAEGKYREAFENLVRGVNRSPRNIEGKKMLAQFFIMRNKQDSAVEVLKRGLPFAYEDLAYMRLYVQLLIAKMDDEVLINVCKNILERNPKSKEIQQYLAMAMATVYSMHGMHKESKEIIEKYGLEKTTPGILRLSKNEWEQGNREEAINIIAKNINRMPDLDPVYALLVNYYIIMGDYEKARQYGSLRIIEKPLEIAPRVDYLRSISNSGDKKAAEEEINRLFENNKNDEKNLIYIANFATDSENLELMRKIYDNAIEKGFSNTSQYCMLLLETFITCKKYQEAIDFSEDIIKANPKWLKNNENVFSALRAVAYYAVGNSNMSTALINDIIKQGTVNPRTLVATARRFALLGEDTIAHKLYVAAVEKDPMHQYALVRLIQFELDAGNSSDLNKYIFRLINMRRPPRDMILEARRKLLTDRFIFTTDREKIINAIDAVFDIEKASGNRIFSDLPSDYDNEKILSTF
ncbi:MAG: hypothetical protein IKO42_03455 [Opitutales bacterium]|nr:hypothetical protein [Opitutales bacterium]